VIFLWVIILLRALWLLLPHLRMIFKKYIMTPGKIIQTLKQSNQTSKVQSLLHLLLLSMSASLTKKLGMAPGGEFRVAVKAAEELEIRPAIILGDRPFNITMQRAIHSLTFRQKIKLFFQFVTSDMNDITKEEIEKCKERDLLEQMLSEMTGEYPSITEVFVSERVSLYLVSNFCLKLLKN
jgi:pheromone shutdown protein TraB